MMPNPIIQGIKFFIEVEWIIGHKQGGFYLIEKTLLKHDVFHKKFRDGKISAFNSKSSINIL